MVSEEFQLTAACDPLLLEAPPFSLIRAGYADNATRRLARLVQQAWERARRPRLPAAPYEIEVAVFRRTQPGLPADGSAERDSIDDDQRVRNAICLARAVLEQIGALPPSQEAFPVHRAEWCDGPSRLEIRVRSQRLG